MKGKGFITLIAIMALNIILLTVLLYIRTLAKWAVFYSFFKNKALSHFLATILSTMPNLK
ncbi:hypothetical protein X781_23650 [Mannheimia sp. USDA-ARS-USMARC-1261]|nr:hypothetical protein X781_23650 [Mannheimia sp. USDA-ARS-USMARC-1261]